MAKKAKSSGMKKTPAFPDAPWPAGGPFKGAKRLERGFSFPISSTHATRGFGRPPFFPLACAAAALLAPVAEPPRRPSSSIQRLVPNT